MLAQLSREKARNERLKVVMNMILKDSEVACWKSILERNVPGEKPLFTEEELKDELENCAHVSEEKKATVVFK